VINVVKEQKGSGLTVRLSGSIEENVNFDQLVGPPPAQMTVNCKGITRINSVGVKSWIKYFQSLSGTKLTFEECSTAIVEQLNLISNFSCGGTVESIFVPFSCPNCKSELVGLFKVESLKKVNFQIPDLKCSKCGGMAKFDDIPEEYFNFAMGK
jgi:predicted RNA-binding Zn-ribbon protein involved in translation (DUF1610 family)